MLLTLMLVLPLAQGQIAPPSFPTGEVKPGSYKRQIKVGETKRSYYFHVPQKIDRSSPAPVVLAFHGAGMDGQIMQIFSGLSKKADQEGFIVVYPNGTGLGDILLTWNAGKFPWNNEREPNDVRFVSNLLDDLETVVRMDPKRVYATGMSNGGMMTYRLAAELGDRIAAIAPVAGCMVCEVKMPKRPMPILHIHGTKDTLVPFRGTKSKSDRFRFGDVEETSLKPWREINDCDADAKVAELPRTSDAWKVVRKEYAAPRTGAEVILYLVEGGGHTWPGMNFHAFFCGEVTYNIIANDLIWDFFRRHRLK